MSVPAQHQLSIELPEPSSAAQSTPAWLAIHLPQLAMDGLIRSGWTHPGTAIIEQIGNQRRVHQSDTHASAMGVRPGMAMTAAYALAPDLKCVNRCLDQEQRTLEVVAQAAYGFTHRVHLDIEQQTVLAEVAGSRRWLKGKRIADFLDPTGCHYRLALAPNPEAAQVLARAGIKRIAKLVDLNPIELRFTSLKAEVIQSFRSMGIITIEEAQGLPTAGLQKRFGRDVVDYLQKLHSLQARHYRWYEPPMEFLSQLALPMPTEDAAALLFAAGRLLGDMQIFLETRELAATSIHLDLLHPSVGADRRRLTRLTVAASQPGRQSDQWRELLKEKLEVLRLESQVTDICLKTGHLMRFESTHGDLFSTGDADNLHAWDCLMERLRARLGDDAISQIVESADHRPEKAWLKSAPGLRHQRTSDWPELPTRPTWLLEKPREIQMGINQYKILAGPERIHTGWWDDEDLARDYFVARDRKGQLLWIYRECASDRAETEKSWFLHGLV